jgi:hypothetical protein
MQKKIKSKIAFKNKDWKFNCFGIKLHWDIDIELRGSLEPVFSKPGKEWCIIAFHRIC